MENLEKKMTTTIEGTGGRFRWAAITAMLLAIGAILRLVSPSIAGISPNWIIAMYCLAIVLTKPSISRAAGIGLVAGAVCLATSKSIFPYGNIVSELLGAVVCALLVQVPVSMKIGSLDLRPAVCTLAGTLVSGFSFVTIAKLALSLPLSVYLYGMLPVVLTVAVINTIIAQLLYYPARKVFDSVPTGIQTKQEK
ncbi:MAG TPA: tryptophan transporter [Negativicutes bacterium]|jgi:energy-coupling factor transport system ATP-binding protein